MNLAILEVFSEEEIWTSEGDEVREDCLAEAFISINIEALIFHVMVQLMTKSLLKQVL